MVDWSLVLIALKLVVAMLCGGAIGFERELSRKPAGLRTNVLICIGAALFMIVSRHIGGGAVATAFVQAGATVFVADLVIGLKHRTQILG